MKKQKRFLSLALALVLCLGLVPTAAMAAETAPLQNCRGATEVTCGPVTFHLSNPVLDVVEPGENSVWGRPYWKTIYVVPLGTEISWEEGIYDDVEENYRYDTSSMRGDFLRTGLDADDEIYGKTSYVVQYVEPITMEPSRSFIVPPQREPAYSVGYNTVSYGVNFCGVGSVLPLSENTMVDMTQYGPVVFNDVAAKKTISVDGETVPLYEIRPDSGFWKSFVGIHGTFTAYDATVENDQLKKGAVKESFDTKTYEHGADSYYSYTYDPEDVGLYQFFEITGEPYEEWISPDPQPTIRFAVHVVADQPTAYQSTQTVQVDGKSVTFECYALKDAAGNLTNYIKLRDLADILNGSAAQFQVGWDGSVTITTKTAYTPNGSEGNTPFSGDRAYQEASNPTKVNGQSQSLAAFVLNDDQGGGYTYYQLRDLAQALGFNVGWSADKGVFVETDKPYDPNN